MRIVFSFLVTLASVFGVVFVITLATSLDGDFSLPLILFVTLVITGTAALVLIAWALPTHLLLRRYGKDRLSSYLIAGAIPGPLIVLVFLPFGHDSAPDLLLQSLFGAVVGVFAAAVFWLTCVRATHNNTLEQPGDT